MKLTRPLSIFDLETTGVDTANSRIVQIGAVRLSKRGQVTRELSQLINPECPIPPEVIEIHGITDDDVKDAPTFADFAGELYSYFDGTDLAGYNLIRFDVPLLSAEFYRCGYDWPAPGTKQLDAFKIFKRQERHTLAKAVWFYTGLEHTNAHDALADVRGTLAVLQEQSHFYKAKSFEKMLELATDPDAYDIDGKLKWEGDVLVLTFGKKHKGEALSEIRYNDPGYLEWILREDFMPDVKEAVRAVLSGGSIER